MSRRVSILCVCLISLLLAACAAQPRTSIEVVSPQPCEIASGGEIPLSVRIKEGSLPPDAQVRWEAPQGKFAVDSGFTTRYYAPQVDADTTLYLVAKVEFGGRVVAEPIECRILAGAGAATTSATPSAVVLAPTRVTETPILPSATPTPLPTSTPTATPAPTGTATPVTSPTPEGASALLFGDDFENGLAQWRLLSGGWQVIEDGSKNHALCVMRQDAWNFATAGSPNWQDIILELDLKLGKASGNAAIVRARLTQASPSDVSAYDVTFESGKDAELVRSSSDTKKTRFMGSLPVELAEDEWHHVVLKVAGPQIEISVDGSPAEAISDGAEYLRRGGIGLGVRGSSVCFDNVKVFALGSGPG